MEKKKRVNVNSESQVETHSGAVRFKANHLIAKKLGVFQNLKKVYFITRKI